jgi:drug/metabolite transporter (DMT)-like permease
VAAAAAQVVRNGAQSRLTSRIGHFGATQVRFVFGLPFAILFLLVAAWLHGSPMPWVGREALAWSALGGLCQIGATALMLAVMHQRAFGVSYAYIKTEPVIVALLGVSILGDRLPVAGWIAIAIVTLGVIVTTVTPSQMSKLLLERKMIVMGIAAGGLFGISAIAFRAAIGELPDGGFVIRSLTILVISLSIQTIVLGMWLAAFDRAAFVDSLREWQHSVGAGFLGALASACWFSAFALTPAANVRTLGLIEIPMAALLSGKLTGARSSGHELAGLALVMIGVALLLWTVAA